ncbi:MAG TPA: dipeptidase [Bacteroidetes bacterium]|nr:MAG: peptidase M20 [Ignavibacteria bacterium GWA2_54_16]HCA80237.1 dipeptidase [Bacteroidota bacterium]
MQQLLAYLEANRERTLAELKEFISIPSVSSQSDHADDMRRCAEWISAHLKAIGLEHVQVMETAGHPLVYADWLGAPEAPTVLLYGHYDVQPVDPVELWSSPPFEATIREGNIYGRGAVDDKGQVFAHFKAFEAYLKNTGKLPLNVKVLVEGEEEIGSEHLDAFVKEHADLLKADLVLISDSDMFARGVPSVCYGLRGLAYMEVEVTGPNGDLHSGSFGGSVHNPIQALAEMIASLHDRNGRITIPGFYKDVLALSKTERSSFRKLPWKDRKYAASLGLKELYGEKGFTTLERLWARPTLECNGIWGGYTGQGAKTVLPSKAYAKISMRLVPNQRSASIARLFEKHMKKIAPKTVSVKVRALHGGEPALTPIESPGVRAAVVALEKGFGKKPLYQREGGSIPIVVQFKEILGIDTVLLGFGLADGNAHAPNEFIVLENFFGGIRTTLHFYNELPGIWAKDRRKH